MPPRRIFAKQKRNCGKFFYILIEKLKNRSIWNYLGSSALAIIFKKAGCEDDDRSRQHWRSQPIRRFRKAEQRIVENKEKLITPQTNSTQVQSAIPTLPRAALIPDVEPLRITEKQGILDRPVDEGVEDTDTPNTSQTEHSVPAQHPSVHNQEGRCHVLPREWPLPKMTSR